MMIFRVFTLLGLLLYANGLGAQSNFSVLENYDAQDANKVLYGDASGTTYGSKIAPAGDVNGDGYSDFLIEGWDGSNFINLHYGSSNGLSNSPAYTFSDQNYSLSSFSTAGDVNGDGYSDVIIGCIYLRNANNQQVGGISVYYGGASGIQSTNQSSMLSDKVNSNFGNSVAMAGDVNGDGYSDILVGANRYNEGNNGFGAAFVVYGSSSGLTNTFHKLFRVNANWVYNEFGTTLAPAGDVNGDGYSDIIVGAYNMTYGKAFSLA